MSPDYSDRRYVLTGIFMILGIILLGRLFFIQILDESYKLSASNNVLRYVVQYPVRGTIYDRSGEILVYNQPAYDLLVIPRQLQVMDTASFCQLTGITPEQFREKLAGAKKFSHYRTSVFIKQLSAETYAAFQEKMYKFPGFSVQNRTVRKYPRHIGAHLLGYVSEVERGTVKLNPYYKTGDYIGASGVEKAYEGYIRGIKGVKVFMVDVHNRIKGSFENGRYDTASVPGKDLWLTLSADLQAYGEHLMENKKGSIVALDPSNGEVLTLVTSPSYDPNLLVGRERSDNFQKLQSDSLKPLFNRALMAQYPPGSVFKVVQALIGLQEGSLTPGTMYLCNKSLVDCHDHPSPQNLHGSIQHSCNPYYYMVFKRILHDISTGRSRCSNVAECFQRWNRHVASFGFGQPTEIETSGEKWGFIPDTGYYNRIYVQGRWNFETVYSLGIGQGEILVSPIQLANLASIIANRGIYYVPHLTRELHIAEDKLIRSTSIDPAYFELVVSAMEDVVEHGTAFRARIKGIAMCGKTGTAQNPHGDDHSLFIAFAPRNNPKIAVSVVVENSGFGATWAAPIASLMIEKYLTGTVTRTDEEERILTASFIDKTSFQNNIKQTTGN